MPGRRLGALVAILAMTAGATDAISFLGLGGVFSSVMTANMVLLGLGAGQQNVSLMLHAGAALVLQPEIVILRRGGAGREAATA